LFVGFPLRTHFGMFINATVTRKCRQPSLVDFTCWESPTSISEIDSGNPFRQHADIAVDPEQTRHDLI
jgi:hypothetical protein